MNEFSETRLEASPADAIAGKLVTETFDYDDGRQVTVYVPPVTSKSIVFAGDGQMIAFASAEGVSLNGGMTVAISSSPCVW